MQFVGAEGVVQEALSSTAIPTVLARRSPDRCPPTWRTSPPVGCFVTSAAAGSRKPTIFGSIWPTGLRLDRADAANRCWCRAVRRAGRSSTAAARCRRWPWGPSSLLVLTTAAPRHSGDARPLYLPGRTTDSSHVAGRLGKSAEWEGLWTSGQPGPLQPHAGALGGGRLVSGIGTRMRLRPSALSRGPYGTARRNAESPGGGTGPRAIAAR